MAEFMSTGIRANRPANRIKKHISRAAAVLAGIGVFTGAVVFCISSSNEITITEEAMDADIPVEMTDAEIPEETEETMEIVSRTFARAAGDYMEITVEADGRSIVVAAAPGSTAEEVLEKAGLSLGDDDVMDIEPGEVLSGNRVITLSRVEYVEKTYRREYELDTEYREDDSLPRGDSKVVTDGEKGEMIVKVRSKMVNGEKVDSEIISKEITVKAVRPVVAMGTLEVDEYSYAAADPEEREPEEERIYAKDNSDSDKYDTDSYEQRLEEEDITVTTAPEEEDITVSETAVNSDKILEPVYSVWTKPEEPEVPEDIYEDPEPVVTEAPEKETVDGMAVVEGSEGICLDGSKPVSRFAPEGVKLDENGIPVNYKEIHRGESCAYTAEEGALMSTGKEVFQGYVAVDPDIIPYGSKLYIIADDGAVYGYAVAADTGYSVGEGHIIVDLFMASHDDCVQWGRRNVTIYVL
ncbi:MAG: G5 domain-containing protein [Oscillospiraceae bacterium]|nr:G5 domain-containing protein [Oscillospiraceae bacterium]